VNEAKPAVAASPAAQGDVAGEGQRRRRRGGRGRRRSGGAPGAEAAVSPVAASTGGNRPSRQVIAQSPSTAEHVAPKKQGFFRRLTSLFTRR
jgi:ATP-dependent RNA helicase RhlB